MAATLIGHWPLAGDAQDASGNNNHGQNHGADLAAPGSNNNQAARFDGHSNYIEVANSPSLQLGTDDFTLSAHIHTEAQLDDPIGDLLTKFDPSNRRGFNLGLKRHSAASTSLSNYRNLHFGIDHNRTDEQWTDCGQLGTATFIMALAVHQGYLYAGTCETDDPQGGHVYRYDGTTWHDLGTLDSSNAVMALTPFNGQLYAGTGRLKMWGSALAPSTNYTEGGRVFRLDNDQWIDCGKMGGERNEFVEYTHDTVHSLEVFQGHLYGLPIYSQGLFRYQGGDQWTDCGSQGFRNFTMGTFRNDLYVLENGSGVLRFSHDDNWTQWTRVADLPGVVQVYSLAVYEGHLVAGTWPNATVFRWEKDGAWSNMGRLGEELEVMGMAIYNGNLYAGTLPLGQVYRYDGNGQWTCTGQLDQTPYVKYRRAWSTAVYNGKLYFGLLPSGRVLSLESGKNATYDHELAAGWKHIAAVRRGISLSLYVDGEVVATSSAFNSEDYDLSNDEPLKIGFGQHDYFNGSLSDVRIYRGALSDDEIAGLAPQS